VAGKGVVVTMGPGLAGWSAEALCQETRCPGRNSIRAPPEYKPELLLLEPTFSMLSIYRCPKSLEAMGILIIFLICIYILKLKVKRLKMALTLDERVEVMLLSGRQGRTQRQVADEFNTRYPESNPKIHSAVGKLVKKFKETENRTCLECRGEHIEHVI
jgi:hypothetical protein